MQNLASRLLFKNCDKSAEAMSTALEKIVVFDIDGTIVDDSQRKAIGQTPAERDKLLNIIEDRPKTAIITKLHKHAQDNYTMIALTGRTSSLQTKKQLFRICQFEYAFIRNSKFFNTDLSSKVLKANFFDALFKILEARKLGSHIIFYEDRLDVLRFVHSALAKVNCAIDIKTSVIEDVYCTEILKPMQRQKLHARNRK